MPRRRYAGTATAQAVAVLNANRRHHPNADHTALERDLKAVKAEDYIRRLVESAPPLTAEQRDRLASLLRPSVRWQDSDVGPEAA